MAAPRRLLIVGLLITVMTVPNVVDANERGSQTKTADRGVVNWPEVKGWRRLKKRSLPEGKGAYSLGFNSAYGVTVTAYTYTRGLPSIPRNLASRAVKQELNKSASGIKAAVQLGIYKSANIEKQGEVHLGGDKRSRKALWKRYRIRSKGNRLLVSDLYITTYRNRFIKIRVSRSANTGRKATQDLQKLLIVFGRHLAK